MTTPWKICPDCGIGPNADHKRDCSYRRRRPLPDYRSPDNRGPETMRGEPVPLQPVSDEVAHG